jgi:hypothetical protein
MKQVIESLRRHRPLVGFQQPNAQQYAVFIWAVLSVSPSAASPRGFGTDVLVTVTTSLDARQARIPETTERSATS